MSMVKFIVDGPNLLLIAKTGITEVDVKVDLYSDAKEHWLTTIDSKFNFPLRVVGGDPTTGGDALGATYFLQHGWRIRPDEVTHELTVTGNIYVDGGGNPFVPTVGNYNVTITRTVTNLIDRISAGSGLSAEQATQLDGAYKKSKLNTVLLLSKA